MKRRTFLTWMGLGWLASASLMVVGAAIARAKRQLASEPESNRLEVLVFYVAPNGNDTWSGKLANPNGKKTDGPFATLQRSRDAIRDLKRQQGGALKQPVTVLILAGTYFLTEPLVFSPEDSGTADFPVTYAAYQDEKPVISGGRRITNWKQETVNGQSLWVTTLSDVKSGNWFFRELWVGDKRLYCSRKPKTGYFLVESCPDVTPETPWNEGQLRFKYRPGNLSKWSTVKDAHVVLMSYWSDSHLPVVSVDETQRIISFSKKSLARIDPGNSTGSGASYYYIENALEILDSPGEWYLSKSTGKLYYKAMPGEEIASLEVIAPVLSQVLRVLGDKTRYVEHLHFQGLTFAHTEWNFTPQFRDSLSGKDSGFGQAASELPGAIYANKVRHSVWQNCTVKHIGNYAIEFAGHSEYNKVINSHLFDLGGGGIKMLNTSRYTQVTNCHIHDGGLIFHGAVAVLIIVDSWSNLVKNCHIHDFYYSGISVGWNWSYAETSTFDNIVELNHIHHIGKLSGDKTPIPGPILNDKGGIYILGVQRGTTLRNNTIHDIDAYNYGAWGIYLDQASSNILIENNLVYRTKDGAFHLHFGKENNIRNNIFAFGTIAQIRRSAPEPHLSFTFSHNIVYWSEGKLLEGNWGDYNFVLDRNVYWRLGGGEIRFADLSWEEWRTKGMDKNSNIVDPLFFAPETGDFRLKPNSPALRIGFQPFPIVG